MLTLSPSLMPTFMLFVKDSTQYITDIEHDGTHIIVKYDDDKAGEQVRLFWPETLGVWEEPTGPVSEDPQDNVLSFTDVEGGLLTLCFWRRASQDPQHGDRLYEDGYSEGYKIGYDDGCLHAANGGEL